MCLVYLASNTINKQLQEAWQKNKLHLKQIIGECRRVTICLDGWSKKGLTSAFLGISACFYDLSANTVRHVTLDLMQISHPHTGEQLAEALNTCLSNWSISADKILLVVTDNGANIVKAIRLLRDAHNDTQAQTAAEPDDVIDDDDSEDDETGGSNSDHDFDSDEVVEQSETQLQLPLNVSFRRMPCMAHTLQLVIKRVYIHYRSVLDKARHLMSKIRKSSVAVQMLIAKCGKTVISDNSTRWNSTYHMTRRLIEIKGPVNEVLNSIRVDSLLIDEWARLEEMTNLLEPFAIQTDILQTDSTSLSSILPSLFDLECHLQQFSTARTLTRAMLTEIHERFAAILNPSYPEFNPLPAVACLVDPNYAALLFTHQDGKVLLEPAKRFLINEV